MTTTTIIVNGFARAGKDSFVAACKQHLHAQGRWPFEFSSITPVKDLIEEGAGIDLSAKTDADRKLLADVGAALQAHSNWRTTRCLGFIEGYMKWGKRLTRDVVMFLHIREPENIQKVITGVKDRNLGAIHTVLLRGPREVRVDNVADNAVLGMSYDDTLYNDSDLDALSVLAGNYLGRKGLIL